jgi:DNA adenine methylase
MSLKAPFPYFGGKSRVAETVWALLGQPKHYIEPFFGSGAVLLGRPNYRSTMIETVNDKDGHIANVWRALQFSPNETARWCDWPVNHADLCARRKWLLTHTPEILDQLSSDPEWHDAKAAGYWIWAASCWIGGSMLNNTMPNVGRTGQGVCSQRLAKPNNIPAMNEKGVNVKIPRMGGRNFGIQAQRPHITGSSTGINAVTPQIGRRPKLAGYAGCGVMKPTAVSGAIYEWFEALSARLRRVRVVCGDWARVCGGNWQDYVGTCGIFFDPPYGHKANRKKGIYSHDDLDVAADVREWARARGEKETYRIVLAGYYEEHESLLAEGWGVYRWSTGGGYGNLGNGQAKKNKDREALFYSPHCLSIKERTLFE